MQDLKDAKDGLQHHVDGAKNNCEEIIAEVETWLKRVDEISEEAHTFLNDDEGHAKALCSSCGSVFHLVTRHQRSRKANKTSIVVCEVNRNKFDRKQISYRGQLESCFTEPKDYETFESRKEILENIMEAVRDTNRSRIGLHGMAGNCKTMLANEIARHAEKEMLFSKVVKTTVSQTPNIKEIQQHIADMLELKFGETDNTKGKRATLLQQRLKPENKILLILDDIWKELNLKEIGIHDECQMLLISRTRHVLHSSMGIAESNVFLLEVLHPLEATSLFKKIIGEIVENAYYKSLARQIVAKCAGLPVSIATMAHAFKCNMELSIWQDALHRLRSSGFIVIEGMDKKVYLSIRLSYDFLGIHEKKAKSLLLLCALHKEDAQIRVEDLMRYSVGCRLLQGVNIVKEARNRVNSLVDKLKSHCLLLDGKSKSYVKMHDVIRDVCIVIANEDEHRMNNITSATMYEEFVAHERHKSSKAISFLGYDDYENLPKTLECPCLELLLLSSFSLKSIPDDFFEQIKKLEALVMGNTRLESLPSSFHFLQNLQKLCLRGYSLIDIAMIGQLRHLQLLDLQGCYGLRVIEPNVISNLTQMEELYLAENENILPEKLFSENLERYQVSIGGGEYSRYNEFPRWLQLNLSNMSEKNASGLKSLVKRSQYLSLERLVDVTNVVHDLDKDGFPRLKHLRLIQLFTEIFGNYINEKSLAMMLGVTLHSEEDVNRALVALLGSRTPKGNSWEMDTVPNLFRNYRMMWQDLLPRLLSSNSSWTGGGDSDMSTPMDEMIQLLEAWAARAAKVAAKKAAKKNPEAPGPDPSFNKETQRRNLNPTRDALLSHRNAELVAEAAMKMEMLQLELEAVVNQREAAKEALAREMAQARETLSKAVS
ncbi:disease resistance protein At4g27190-like [Humulus lupulus]|uniref:disease resistance protein At4g27190-like n=1 Tax=Humulus lupulus TaxID=3486 RepID=UPI002B41009C|nr:disease resistance protein At4g27190-like [Humulus lupulus]